jgi:hypothetical protein
VSAVRKFCVENGKFCVEIYLGSGCLHCGILKKSKNGHVRFCYLQSIVVKFHVQIYVSTCT